jgi:hypothetical protein
MDRSIATINYTMELIDMGYSRKAEGPILESWRLFLTGMSFAATEGRAWGAPMRLSLPMLPETLGTR